MKQPVKHFFYLEWLQWLIDHPLKAWGIEVDGIIDIRSEDGDGWNLSILDDQAFEY